MDIALLRKPWGFWPALKETPVSPILDKPHTDYPWPFSLIPRRWTAFQWGRPQLVAGHMSNWWESASNFSHVLGLPPAPKPISSPITWQLSRFPAGPWWAWYFAWSGKRKADGKFLHFRLGARWDDVDSYVQFPSIALRRYTGDDSQNTEA